MDVLCYGLYIVPQMDGTVEDYLINFMGSIKYHLELCDVYLIFDRYVNTSTKQMTRSSRSGNDGSRKHLLNLATILPAQKVVLNITYNKIQLIDLICQYLVNHIVNNYTKLVITGKDPTPVSYFFGIGKAIALKALMGRNHLNLLGQLGADEENLIVEATAIHCCLLRFQR